MQLIRLLLIDAEGTGAKPDLSQYTEDVLKEHKRLLIERKLAEGCIDEIPVAQYGQVIHKLVRVRIDRLTWEGHDFLANARNEVVWKKTLAKIKEKAADVSFDLLKDLLKSTMKQQFGISE